MSIELRVVDAFTSRPFSGNPAAVCVLDAFPDDSMMQDIAAEMNLAETAFVVERGVDRYDLRWFTPAIEVPLCGHATLASAHVLFTERAKTQAAFDTKSGTLTCTLAAGASTPGGIEMDFPADSLAPSPTPLGQFRSVHNQMTLAILASADDVRAYVPDLAAIAPMPHGLIVTAPSDDPAFDFVSRFFAPGAGIAEDPVTGAAHCVLAPYWAQRLGRNELVGYQASRRGGTVRVRVNGDRVILSGYAVTTARTTLLV